MDWGTWPVFWTYLAILADRYHRETEVTNFRSEGLVQQNIFDVDIILYNVWGSHVVQELDPSRNTNGSGNPLWPFQHFALPPFWSPVKRIRSDTWRNLVMKVIVHMMSPNVITGKMASKRSICYAFRDEVYRASNSRIFLIIDNTMTNDANQMAMAEFRNYLHVLRQALGRILWL
jgi:hypothetical protein